MTDWDHSGLVVYAAGVLAPVFAENEWVWTTRDGPHVPTESEIALHLDADCRRMKQQLLEDMEADPGSPCACSTNSGRLMVSATFHPEDGDPELSVLLDLGACWPAEVKP